MNFASFCLVVGICLFSICHQVNSFKAHEFKKCEDSHFCKRNRGSKFGNQFEARIGEIKDGSYVGDLVNAADELAQLYYTISAYDGGIVRVTVKERDSRRFEVPEVVENDLEKSKIAVSLLPNVEGNATAVSLLADGNRVQIETNPFTIRYLDANGVEILAINSHGFFNFEHRRQKQEGAEQGLWEEHFKTHRDSKPNGPEAISLDLTFSKSKNVYGIPEHATSLSLKPTVGEGIHSEPYRLYNLDVFEYEHESPFGLYGSVPFMLSLNEDRSAGFFWLNAAEMWVDVHKSSSEAQSEVVSQWIAEAGVLDAFFFSGPNPKSIIDKYTRVTGRAALPPFFATAYHQCRWNYKDEADVAFVDSQFDLHDLPYDVLWLDIEHTQEKKYMTWDASLFPTPQRMQEDLGSRGRHSVAIIDPHVKRDAAYSLHLEATQKKYYVKDKDGGDFDGWCWPGSSSYLDVLSPEIRNWWASKFSYSSYQGSTPWLHVWNDMNEPSVFNGPEVTMPKDCQHFGGAEHREVHNVYGYLYHLATKEGLLQRESEGKRKRPFVLSRALYAGTQKVGAIWTGDNTANWDHLRVSVPMLLSLGLSGISFAGADVGGFFGDPNAELMVRWFQLGAFYPFFRGHAHLDTKRREPYLFGEPFTSHIREALRLRYSLLPHIYTLFWEASKSGTPLMRPLFFEYPSDLSLFDVQDSFLLGPSLLVHPVTQQGATSVEVLFPGNERWFHVISGEEFPPRGSSRKVSIPVSLSSILAFQKEGSIVVRKDRVRRSSTQMGEDPYTLVVALSSKWEAQGEIYLDDGESFEFEKGAYLHRWFHFAIGRLFSSNLTPKGSKFKTKACIERIVFLGFSESDLASTYTATLDRFKKGKVANLEFVRDSAYLRPGLPKTAMVLRMPPKVNIGDDWALRVFKKD